MMNSQVLKSVDFTKTQKYRYLENETFFLQKKKRSINYTSIATLWQKIDLWQWYPLKNDKIVSLFFIPGIYSILICKFKSGIHCFFLLFEFLFLSNLQRDCYTLKNILYIKEEINISKIKDNMHVNMYTLLLCYSKITLSPRCFFFF